MKLVTQYAGDKRDVAVATAAVVTLGLFISILSRQSSGKKEKRKMAHVPASTLPLLGNMLDVVNQQPRFHDWVNEQSMAFDNEPWQLQIPGRTATV
ncbi:hypothetical protein BBJ28_00002650, partial [Nothophytophthora sp. Chile5]